MMKKIIFQAFDEKKVPTVELPLGQIMKTRKKTACKPDKASAIAKQQSRMKK